VGEVLVADRLYMLDIDDFTEGAGVDDLFHGDVIWRVSQNYTLA
jgi:hypothetical protein